jgi:branched-chain amino acid transport system substrate-binding protein
MFSRWCLGLAALLSSATGGFSADLTVGFVTSLSGPGALIVIPYEKVVLAAHAYAGKVGDINIKLIRLDNGSDPSAATRNARKLVKRRS